MTNFEFFKDAILEMASNNGNIAVIRNAPANSCIKDCSVTSCGHCLFNNPNDKSCAQERYEWFYEEYKEIPTLTKREWYFLKALQHGEIYRDTLGNMFWQPDKNKIECKLTDELHKGLFGFCEPDRTRFNVEEMLNWEIVEN